MLKDTEQNNSDENPYSLNEDDKVLLLKQSIHQIQLPSFLCRRDHTNINFLEIIECNNHFLKCFDLENLEVIGNNYDFLLQNVNFDYGSDNYFRHINLIKAVKILKASDIKVGIPYPKDRNQIEIFTIRFVPSCYKTENIYCIFSFEKLLQIDQEDSGLYSHALIKNLERTVKNERMLRNISCIIAEEQNLKEASKNITKIMCNYLKIDRCILYNCNDGEAGFLVEHCSRGVKKISDAGNISEPESPMARYIELQNKLFFDVSRLKKSTTMTIYEDIESEAKFTIIEDVCKKFGIGSQIVVIIVSNDKISGGFYLQQSGKRNWFSEEVELINIISSHFSIAIERSNYSQSLVEKSNKLLNSLVEEKRMRDLQSEFVTLVSHEFKTPLQIIDGARELVLRKLKTANIFDETVDKSLDRIKNAIIRMDNLIQSNLNLSKIEIGEGEVKINKQNFNIQTLVRDIAEKNSYFAQEKCITVAVNVDNLPNSYCGDQKLLDHSFTNIIANAIKYSKPNSVVKIFGDVKKNKIFLRISDDGIGIPQDDLGKIGKKFFRAKNAISVSGTGIGIYLAEHFIELHGGLFLIESELTVGTVVTITLPTDN